MVIGVPKEIKNHEYRVGLTSGSVRELVVNDHEVIVQTKAGDAIGFADDMYRDASAKIIDTPDMCPLRKV
jgi:alanine dehydrogenase